MFEKKDSFPWKKPAIALTGVVVLTGGIYIGVKTRDTNQEKTKTQIEQTVEKTTETFELNKNCEIWLQKNNEDGSVSEEANIMLGTVPQELLGKSKKEIVSYFKTKYPDRSIESMNKSQIILSEIISSTDISKANKYTVESNDGFIAVYKYDEQGKKKLIEQTQIKMDSLPKTVQDEIEKGITVDTEDEAYSKLEDFGS